MLGIYVNNGTQESALREVPHGQLAAYGCDTLPAPETQADLKDGQSNWYYDAAAQILYADFGGTLGTADPNAADVSILYNSEGGPAGHEPLFVLPLGSSDFSFIGLTLRAGSWGGLYAETSGNTLDHCDVKFNGGGGIAFDATGNDVTVTGNAVTYSRIYMNVLNNWPRFNNGNATGGWPGGLGFYSESNALAQGNVIYGNGGEGLLFWGTNSDGTTAHKSVGNEARDNVVYDNWSVNIYLDNTQGARVEQNFVFTHPRDASETFANLFTLSNGYANDWGKRLTPAGISLADEPGSAFDGQAHLSDITMINNIFAGGAFGFVDYDDGTSGVVHGLKNCLLANNTWVLGAAAVPGQQTYGWRHLYPCTNPDASVGSFVENDLFSVANAGDHFIEAGQPGAGPGITCDDNLYSGPGGWDSTATPQDFTAWKAAHPPWDQHSTNADAQLPSPSEFGQSAAVKPVYDWSKAAPGPGSPASSGGLNLATQFTSDFTGKTRPAGNFDQGALSR